MKNKEFNRLWNLLYKMNPSNLGLDKFRIRLINEYGGSKKGTIEQKIKHYKSYECGLPFGLQRNDLLALENILDKCTEEDAEKALEAVDSFRN